MQNNNHTIAPASEGTSANTVFTHEVQVNVIDGFERVPYVAPALPSTDWDTLHAATCMDRCCISFRCTA